MILVILISFFEYLNFTLHNKMNLEFEMLPKYFIIISNLLLRL